MSEIIGIDPGKTGYVVAVDGDGVAWSRQMPETPTALAELLRDHTDACFFVERQFALHGQGLNSTFTIAQGFGRIEGVLAGLGARLWIIGCKDWQKAMLKGEPKASGKELKAQYVAVAERAWPSIQFRGPKGGLQDGKAAAALMAEYGRRLLMGEKND